MEATKTCFVINYIKSSKEMGHVQELEGMYTMVFTMNIPMTRRITICYMTRSYFYHSYPHVGLVPQEAPTASPCPGTGTAAAPGEVTVLFGFWRAPKSHRATWIPTRIPTTSEFSVFLICEWAELAWIGHGFSCVSIWWRSWYSAEHYVFQLASKVDHGNYGVLPFAEIRHGNKKLHLQES